MSARSEQRPSWEQEISETLAIMRLVIPEVDHPGILFLTMQTMATASAGLLTPEDMFHLGVFGISMPIGQRTFPRSRSVTADDMLPLFSISAGCMASNAPAIVRATGLSVSLLALSALKTALGSDRFPHLANEDDRQISLARSTVAVHEVIVAKHEELAHGRFLSWLTDRLGPAITLVDAKKEVPPPDVSDLVYWHDMLWDVFSKPLLPSAKRIADTVLKVAKTRHLQHALAKWEDVADIWPDWMIHLLRGRRSGERPRHLSDFVGRDGEYHFDGRGFLDSMKRAALANARIEMPPEEAQRLPLELQAAGQALPDPDEVAASRDEQSLQKRVADIILAAAVDDMDRESIRLIRETTMSRRARARELGISEAALRKREKKLRERAYQAAPPRLKPVIRGLSAS